jgi:hypothetical protein
VGEALEPGRPKLAQLEQLAQEPPGAIRDHHSAGCSRLLQPRRQIRRFAHYRFFAGGAVADEVPHDHKTAGDAGPCAERLAGRRGQLADHLGNCQASPHGTLGLVLVRLRPAEIGQHAIAHELGDVTLVTGDLARTAFW